MQFIGSIFIPAMLGGLLAGCSVVKATPDEVSVDTELVGELMPGTRHWLGWLRANEHCAAQGKSPQLHDLTGTVAVYRCVSD